MCCAADKVGIQISERFTAALRNLYSGQDEDCISFRQNIRKCISGPAMALIVANIETPRGYGPHCFRVHGQVYHTISRLCPRTGQAPRFARILIMDTEEAAQELAGRRLPRAYIRSPAQSLEDKQSLGESVHDDDRRFRRRNATRADRSLREHSGISARGESCAGAHKRRSRARASSRLPRQCYGDSAYLSGCASQPQEPSVET